MKSANASRIFEMWSSIADFGDISMLLIQLIQLWYN